MCLLWWSHHKTITLFSGPDAPFVILTVTGELFTGGSPTWGTRLAQTTLDILGLVRLEYSRLRLMEHDSTGMHLGQAQVSFNLIRGAFVPDNLSISA